MGTLFGAFFMLVGVLLVVGMVVVPIFTLLWLIHPIVAIIAVFLVIAGIMGAAS